MNDRKDPRAQEPSQRVAVKPERETSAASADSRETLDPNEEPVGADQPQHLGKGRDEVIGAATEPPHVPDSDRHNAVQDDLPNGGEVPLTPASASGFDKLTPEEQDEGIDDRSMYDGRPERDKHRPPSQR
jgi:hypothetical protein